MKFRRKLTFALWRAALIVIGLAATFLPDAPAWAVFGMTAVCVTLAIDTALILRRA